MDLSAMCEALQATQQPDGEARKKAEQLLDQAASSSPNQLVAALAGVLASPGAQVADALRQEAAVILRQLVVGIASRDSVWDNLDAETKRQLMAQLLRTVETDASNVVRRNASQPAVAIGNKIADTFDELQKEWPEILPFLSKHTGNGSDPTMRVLALNMLKDLTVTVGQGLLNQGAQAVTMLSAALADPAAEVRAAAAQVALTFVEDLDPGDVEPVKEVMPAVVTALQGLATPATEELLKDTLEVLISAVEAESQFFKEAKCVEKLSETLLGIAGCRSEAFGEEDVRHSSMEALMALTLGLEEDVAKPEGLPLLEALVAMNIRWMLEVEENVEMWTNEGKNTDEDDCDGDAVGIGEENMDRLAETFEEDTLMPIIFKVIRSAMQQQDGDWKNARACLMAVAQVAEHLEEEAWVNQCVEFVMQHLAHAHPRVRYSAFWAVAQICYDQAPDVQTTYHETLLPAIVTGIDDANIRVATVAVSAFASLGEELDSEDMEPQMDDLLMRMFNRLHAGESRALQEHCLSGIAVIAEASEELFLPYYTHVIPMLKQVISKCTKEEERSLQGKAFECVSLIGKVVGKETFLPDACEIMGVMMPLAKDGFAADDPRRESFHEAAGNIASTLGADFKPYVEMLLPSIFNILKQRPAESPEDDDDNDSLDENLQMLGLKTSVLEEMEEALELMDTLVEALEGEFCDFLPATCQNLLPLLDMQLSEGLRDKIFKTWEVIAGCAHEAAGSGRIDASIVRELVTEFLKKTVGAMMSLPKGEVLSESTCTTLQSQAAGCSLVIRKAGKGVLTHDGVKDIAAVIAQLLDGIPCPADTPSEPGLLRRRGGPVLDEDSDGDEIEPEDKTPVSAQSVRFSLCDMIGALMRANPEAFVEVVLPTFMELVKTLVKPERPEQDRSLGFYLADDVVACMGEKSVPYWNCFMNEALVAMLDNSAVIRQFAASTIGNGAPQAIFAQVSKAAATQVQKVLQKQGERHRRRRAVKADAKQSALAVDACIRALGQICEHHDSQFGADAGAAWDLWLSNLPLKYNVDAGKAAHAQLVELVVKNHPVLTTPERLRAVLTVFTEIYRSKFSTTELDDMIAKAVSSLGEEHLRTLCSGFKEKQQKKMEQMLKTTRAGA